MPFFPRRFSETLFRASLYLLVIVIPFTTMAIPVITQELSKSTNPATATDTTISSKLTSKEIFDIVFALGLDATFRPTWDAVLHFRLRALFQRAADDVVGPDSAGPGAAPQTHDDGTSPTPVPTSSLRLRMQNVEFDALSTAPQCASSASDDSGLTSPSSA
ncbi:hypothetical protein V8E52_005175 [Russula decolorans]